MPNVPISLRRQSAVRKPRRRSVPPRRAARARQRLSWRARLILIAVLLVAISLGWAAIARSTAPQSNTSLTRFDAIIVLGTPADREGNPRPNQLARVTEGVQEYERGVAPHLILTGGAAHNQFVEAQVMARVAEAQGVPGSAIVVEPEAKDTIQNACYSARMMKRHGWRSAEVVATAEQLPRAALILNRLPIEWRTHPAPLLQPESSLASTGRQALEVLKTMRFLLYANWAEACSP